MNDNWGTSLFADMGLNGQLRAVDGLGRTPGQIDPMWFRGSAARGVVTRNMIQDLAVGNAQIGSAAVTTAKIGSAAITNAKIGTAAIGTANIGTLSFNEISGGTINVLANLGTGNIKLDGANKQIIINDGTNDRILIGFQSGGF